MVLRQGQTRNSLEIFIGSSLRRWPLLVFSFFRVREERRFSRFFSGKRSWLDNYCTKIIKYYNERIRKSRFVQLKG